MINRSATAATKSGIAMISAEFRVSARSSIHWPMLRAPPLANKRTLSIGNKHAPIPGAANEHTNCKSCALERHRSTKPRTPQCSFTAINGQSAPHTNTALACTCSHASNAALAEKTSSNTHKLAMPPREHESLHARAARMSAWPAPNTGSGAYTMCKCELGSIPSSAAR